MAAKKRTNKNRYKNYYRSGTGRRISTRGRNMPTGIYKQPFPSAKFSKLMQYTAYFLYRNAGLEVPKVSGFWAMTKNEKMFVGTMVNLIERIGEKENERERKDTKGN